MYTQMNGRHFQVRVYFFVYTHQLPVLLQVK